MSHQVLEPAGASLAEARRSVALLEAALEGLSDGVLAIDRHERILYWSPACARLTGQDPADVTGRSAQRCLGEIAAKIAPRRCGQVTGLLEVAAGTLPVRATIVTAEGPGGVQIGKVCALSDLRGAWEQRAEQERLAALASLGQGVAWAVHQIRNPLGAAAGFAELMEQDLAASESAPLLGKMRECLAEIDRRMGEILAYARPAELRLVSLDLRDLIDPILGDLGSRFPAGPALECQLPDQQRLLADQGQLRQALENLLVNAAEAAGAQGRVRLLVQNQRPPGAPDSLRLLIKNTGAALSQERLSALFQPFVSGRAGGTGLGLPLARRIIEAHGGEIGALSAGGWTTFVVTLPLETAIAAEAALGACA